MPAGVRDRDTLRCALRSDGVEGVVFVAWTQVHEQVAEHPGVELRVALGDGAAVRFPRVAIPAGTVARWPVNLAVGGSRVRWATASVVTELVGGGGVAGPTLVLLAEPGIPAQVGFEDRVVVPVVGERVAVDGGAVLVLDAADRLRLWVLEVAGARRLFRSDVPLWVDGGRVFARVGGSEVGGPEVGGSGPDRSGVEVWDGAGFVAVAGADVEGRAAVGRWPVEVSEVRDAAAVPTSYGERDGRAAAPSVAVVAERGARWEVTGLDAGGVAGAASGTDVSASLRRRLTVEFAGDVAHLVVPCSAGTGGGAGSVGVAGGAGSACRAGAAGVGGEPAGICDGAGWHVVADRFWDGTPWHLDLDAAGVGAGAQLRILPLAPDAPVWLAPAAAERRRAGSGDLCALDAVTLEVSDAVVLDLPPLT